MDKFIRVLTGVFLLVSSVVVLAAGNREDIHASADLVQPLLPGMEVPEFTIKDIEGKDFRFEAANLDKPLVLTFFRGGW